MNSRHILIVGLILGLAVVAYGSHPYISDPGTLLDGFEDVNDWSISPGAVENDTIHYREGTQSLKLTGTNGGYVAMTRSGLSLDLSSGDGISLWFYVSDTSKLDSMGILISSSNFSKYFIYTISVVPPIDGWNYVVIAKSQFTNVNNESWSNTMIRIIKIKCALHHQLCMFGNGQYVIPAKAGIQIPVWTLCQWQIMPSAKIYYDWYDSYRACPYSGDRGRPNRCF